MKLNKTKQYQGLYVKIPKEIHTKLKVYCARQNEKIKEWIAQTIIDATKRGR